MTGDGAAMLWSVTRLAIIHCCLSYSDKICGRRLRTCCSALCASSRMRAQSQCRASHAKARSDRAAAIAPDDAC
jgi:hypothetical protein